MKQKKILKTIPHSLLIASSMIFFLSATPASAKIFKNINKNQSAPKVNSAQAEIPSENICIQHALNNRDTALIAAVNKKYSSMQSLLETRMKSLASAWKKTNKNDRREAIQQTWKIYKNSMEQIQDAFRNEKWRIWLTFYNSRKMCGQNGAMDDRTTESIDSEL